MMIFLVRQLLFMKCRPGFCRDVYKRQLEWGHHFAYYPSKKRTISYLNKQVIIAFQQLREGNVDSFADGIADCYRYNLSRMKKNMIEKYKFRNVANIRVPEKY